MGLISTLIYTAELILCFTICVLSAMRHNIHTYPDFLNTPSTPWLILDQHFIHISVNSQLIFDRCTCVWSTLSQLSIDCQSSVDLASSLCLVSRSAAQKTACKLKLKKGTKKKLSLTALSLVFVGDLRLFVRRTN